MKTERVKSLAEKVTNCLIIGLVVLGTAVFGAVSQAPEDGEYLSKAFLVFFGAVITVQLVPGLILLAAMLKGIASLGKKEERQERGRE